MAKHHEQVSAGERARRSDVLLQYSIVVVYISIVSYGNLHVFQRMRASQYVAVGIGIA